MCQGIPITRLNEEPYAKIVCYPKLDRKELRKRLKELRSLGVKTLVFAGEKEAFNIPVLGKGCVGIVVSAISKHGKIALKIRRVDADRTRMLHEAEMLKIANNVNVGPRLLNVSENFLLMEHIEGKLLPEWVKALRGRGIKLRIRHVLRNVLEQCWRLDRVGLDHGELSHAPKHILVNANDCPCIVDFETASVKRRVANVTSLCQFLFIGSQTAKLINRKFGKPDKQKLIRTLKSYKHQPTRESFDNTLTMCRLI